MKKVITDGGRKQAGFTESKDCTVRALARVSNMSYDQAHSIMAQAGRIPHRGASVMSGILIARGLNLLNYRGVDLPEYERTFNAAPGFVGINGRPILMKRMIGPTVKQFVEAHPRGRYIVRIKKHVFAVINGVLYDLYKQHGGALVQAAWEIIL